MTGPEAPGLPSALARIAEIRGSARPAQAPAPAGDGFALPPSTQALSRTALGLPSAQGAPQVGASRVGQAVAVPAPIAPPPAPPGGVLHPLGGAGEVIGHPHAGTHTLGNWQSDNAIDVRVPEGSPIYAVADGVIGPNIGPLDSSEPRFAGERLTLEGAGNAYYYAHLSEIVVGAGQPVVQGQLLGYSGSANGVPHLHFGQREGSPEMFTGGSHRAS